MKSFRYFCLFLSFIVSLIIPRSKNLVVFGSRDGKRFSDNSRYLFFYMKRFSNKKVIWLTKSKKIKSYLLQNKYLCFFSYSILGLYYGFRAKYHIYDYSEKDTSEFSSIKSIKINLGHGIYLKKVLKYKPVSIISKMYNYLINSKKNFHTYPNKKYAGHIINYFPKQKYNLLLSNHPSNIVFYYKKKIPSYLFTKKEKKIIKKIKKAKGKIIGYFPTWRKNGYDMFFDVETKSQLLNLNNLLKKNNSFIITKHHSNIFKEDGFTKINKKTNLLDNNLKKLSNFINLDYDIDLNAILVHCDLLISDYSGAIADYLISKKPIILYVPDYKKYSLDPGLNFNYSFYKFGHIAKNYNSLIRYLSIYFISKKNFSIRYMKERENIKKKFFIENSCFKEILKKIN
jgi:CDP-glycerol glycerophosphotransferase (TagB/SpsB family)